MADERPRQVSLKAILFADLAEYSRLVSQREQETLDFVEACFAAFRERCAAHDGQLVKTTGDGVMVEFSTASKAVDHGTRRGWIRR